MQLVEQHVISKIDPRYAALDRAAFASKNLYNAALYECRQSFIHQGKYLYYNQMDKIMQRHETYRALPSKVSQQVLKLLDKNWKSFFAALEAYNEDPFKFLGRPRLPKYKDKTAGRNVLVYTIQALSKPALKQGMIKPSGLPIEIKTKQKHVDQVRIVPRLGFYVVEVIYDWLAAYRLLCKRKAIPARPAFLILTRYQSMATSRVSPFSVGGVSSVACTRPVISAK